MTTLLTWILNYIHICEKILFSVKSVLRKLSSSKFRFNFIHLSAAWLLIHYWWCLAISNFRNLIVFKIFSLVEFIIILCSIRFGSTNGGEFYNLCVQIKLETTSKRNKFFRLRYNKWIKFRNSVSQLMIFNLILFIKVKLISARHFYDPLYGKTTACTRYRY